IILLTAKNEKQDIIKGLNNGADDYIRKPFDPEELEARIKVGFRYLTLQEQLHGEMKKLREALEHIRTLQGLLPICMHCHKIRDDEGYWEKLEVYIEDHSLAEFSHSICPDCMEKIYGELDQRKKSSATEGSC
ncbi:MAG: response regulator, partial [Lentisphaerae bacterium]